MSNMANLMHPGVRDRRVENLVEEGELDKRRCKNCKPSEDVWKDYCSIGMCPKKPYDESER